MNVLILVDLLEWLHRHSAEYLCTNSVPFLTARKHKSTVLMRQWCFILDFQIDILVTHNYVIHNFYRYKSENLKQWLFHKILVAMVTECLMYRMTIFLENSNILAHKG